MTGLMHEPAILCLLASLVWAPVVYFAAARLDRGRALSASELVWLAALLIAALPTLVAPALSAAGISLRPAAIEAPDLAFDAAIDGDAGWAAPALIDLPASPYADVLAEGEAGSPLAAMPPLTSETLINAAALLYFYGVLLFFGQWMFRALVFANRVGAAPPLDYPGLLPALESWRRALGVDAPVRVKKTSAVASVCVYGLARPVILIPAELDARISTEDLIMMCAHELAHVKREDGRLFAMLQAARILFWFNPFVKRIAARAELAAEQSADALVLARGADRRAYAACFVEGLRFAAERGQRAVVAVPSFTPFDRRSRRMRLDAILSGAPRAPASRLAGFGAILAASLLAVAQAALAVQPAPHAAIDRLPADGAIDRLPVDGAISLDFGKSFADKSGKRRAHEGVDIRAGEGEPVYAAGDGRVVAATDLFEETPAWGKVVVIDHGDGLETRYAHLAGYDVKPGDRVTAGEKIAAVGTTGDVTGAHLHFETLLDGVRVDPLAMLDVRRAPEAPEAPQAFAWESPPEPQPAPAPTPAPAPSPTPAAAPAPAPFIVVRTNGVNVAAPVAPKAKDKAKNPHAAPLFVMLDELQELDRLTGDLPGAVDFGDFNSFAFATGDGEDDGPGFGQNRVTFQIGDGETFVLENGKEMTPEQRARFEKSLERMRAEMRDAQAKHKEAMAEWKKSLKARDEQHRKRVYSYVYDAEQQVELDERFIERESARAEAEQERAEQQREGAEQRAEEIAERERERAEARAERDRDRAEEIAERQREIVVIHRDMAREFARAQEDADRVFPGDAKARLEMLNSQVKALEEAERNIREERARIEKLRRELEKETAGEPRR